MSDAEASSLRMRFIEQVAALQQIETDLAAWNQARPDQRIELDLSEQWRIANELGTRLVADGIISTTDVPRELSEYAS